MALIAKCTECGALDSRRSYRDADDAAKQGAFDRWTCPTCAWTESELVEETQEATAGSR